MKGLIDRFLNKPEWQHPDPVVRAEAVLRLPSSEREALVAIAQDDEEPRVRRAAARKLSDTDTLAELARSDPDDGVQEEAASRLVHLVVHATEEKAAATALAALSQPRHLSVVARSAALEPIREAAIGAMTDPRSLAAVVREAEDGATRLLALERIEDVPTLLAIALKSDQKSIAVAAVERLSDREALQEVAEKARTGAAARRARARLEPDELADERPASALPSPEQDEKEKEAYERARTQHEQEATERAEALAARTRICESVEGAQGEKIPAALEQARAEWETLTPLSSAEAETARAHFDEALVAGERRHAAFLAGLARRDEITTLVTQAEELAATENAGDRSAWAALKKKWKELAASADQPDLRTRFEKAAAGYDERQRASREESEQKDRKNLVRLTKLAEKAEALLTRKDAGLRDADHASREIRSALDHPGHFPSREDREAVLARLETARKALYPRVQQLREDAEWKRWANVSVQEELCRRAEALAEEEENLGEVAGKLRDLDARWKQAKEAPKDKSEELWKRFKTPRDVVKGRVDAYFAQQSKEFAENLQKKEALCEKAEALADSTEWVKTAAVLRGLQAEWKEIGPVPRSRSSRIWSRFRKPCDRFFTQWQAHRGEQSKGWAENLELKESLCEKAEAVMDSTDWEPVSSELKRLQTEWRTIGAVKNSRSDAVWRRFRKACDHFFDRYKHRDSLAVQAVQGAREQICADLEGLVPEEGAGTAAPDDLVARVLAAQTAWRQAGDLPRDAMAPLTERFAQARDRLVALHPSTFAGTELDPEASRRKAEKLVARVEAALEESTAQQTAATAETTEDLAARLREALAANTIGGHEAVEARWASATTEVESAQAAWRRLGPLTGPEGTALAERFDRACTQFLEKRPRPRSRPEPARRSEGAKRRPRRRA